TPGRRRRRGAGRCASPAPAPGCGAARRRSLLAAGRPAGRPTPAPAAPARSGDSHPPVAVDPFAIPLERKLEVLLAADAAMGRVPAVRVRDSSLEFVREQRLFAS